MRTTTATALARSARAGAKTQRAHRKLFFALLPSSCIRCRQKVRFLRQPGMVMKETRKWRRGLVDEEDEGGGGGDEEEEG